MDVLAKALRKRARELALSHAAIARRVGIGARRYGHYVSGRHAPDLATLARIAAALQTTPGALLGMARQSAKASPSRAGRKRVTLRLPVDKWRELKIVATTLDTTMDALIRCGLDLVLAERNTTTR